MGSDRSAFEPHGGRVVVGFVQRELERLESALHEAQSESAYRELYAAQQALSWALEPSGFKAPYDTITEGLIQPLMGTQGGLGDCSDVLHQPPS
jgi:hypothetical protein